MSKRNVDEILSLVTSWRPEGGGVVAVCPGHPDSHPSLRLDVQEGGKLLVHCRAGCSFGRVMEALHAKGFRGGARGSWEWPTDLSGVSLVGAEDLPIEEEDLVDLLTLVRQANRSLDQYTKLGALGLEYIADRFGLSPADADALRLGVTEKESVEWWPIKRTWSRVPRLVVPFLDWEGKPVGAQARALVEDPVRWTGLANGDGGASWAKMAYMRHDDGLDHAIVTEGPSDGLTAYAQGYTAVVIRGAALSQSGEVLDELALRLEGMVISVAGDNDNAGATFRDTLLVELSNRGMDVRPLRVPEAYGDLNEWSLGDDDFSTNLHTAIRGAVPKVGIILENPLKDIPTDGTNAGIAEAFLEWARKDSLDVVYIRGYGAVVYAGGVWHPGAEHRLNAELLRFRKILKEYVRAVPEADRGPAVEVVESVAKKLGSQFFRASVLKDIAAMVREEEPDALDAIEDLLLVANGVVNLRTGALGAPDPDFLMSTRVKVHYDPDARAPRWERFLMEIMEEDPVMVSFLQRFLGYGVTGSTRENAMGIFYGHGANGKTVLMEALQDVVGEITKAVPFSVFEGDSGRGGGASPELARLRGARLTLTSEGEQGAPIREALIKSMTGSDTITARHLYQEDMEFKPRHLIMMATNHLPTFRGVDEGLWRRVKLVPFSRYFKPEERDHYLSEKLREEAPGILTWLVEGAKLWYRDGLQEPDKVLAATNALRNNTDLLAGFYPGVLVASDGDKVKLAKAYEAWEDWASEEAEAAYTARWLGRELESRGLVKRRSNEGMVIDDVRLTTEAERKKLYEEELV